MEYNECIQKGFLKKIPIDKAKIKKELESAVYDLGRSQNSAESSDYKWATVQGYYSIFHSFRALLFSVGLQEKKHFAIGIVLEKLAMDKKIDPKLVGDFHAAMSAREDADYRDVYSRDTAEYIIEMAEDILKDMMRSLRISTKVRTKL